MTMWTLPRSQMATKRRRAHSKLTHSPSQADHRRLAKPWECACEAPLSDKHLGPNDRVFLRLESKGVFVTLAQGMRLFRVRAKLSFYEPLQETAYSRRELRSDRYKA